MQSIDSFSADKESEIPSEFEYLSTLRRAWLNESRCPEILRFETDAVSEVKAWLRENRESSVGRDFAELILLNNDRVEYVLKAYLRSRLFKIQSNFMYYLRKEREKLSSSELRFAQSLEDISAGHFHSSFLHCLPGEEVFQSISNESDPAGSMIRRPDLNSWVLTEVIERVGRFTIGSGSDSHELDLDIGGVHLVKYADIRPLVITGKLTLV